MQDPELIWRLGRWLAGRPTGEARLFGSQVELLLRLENGRILAAEVSDSSDLAGRLGCPPAGHSDLIREAITLATSRHIDETQAIATAKEMMQETLEAWILDPERKLVTREVPAAATDGPTISAAHAVVERVLAHQDATVTRTILPDFDVLLRRADGFLELYSQLRLSEEADLIVAKITGQRSAADILERSPHPPEEVANLLAALVAAGMLEATPAAEPLKTASPELLAAPVAKPAQPAPKRRRLPPWALVAALAAAVVVLVLVVALWRPDDEIAASPVADESAEWGVVVDMGCEPQELQRVLKKAHQYPEELLPVTAEGAEGSPCWRLVWGRFPSREAAAQGISSIPAHLRLNGFSPHPIELPLEQEADATKPGGS